MGAGAAVSMLCCWAVSIGCSGCTVVGYGVGRVFDRPGFEEMPNASVRDLKRGWTVRVETSSGAREGVVRGLLTDGPTDVLLLELPELAELDSVRASEVQRIDRGGRLGNPTAIGTFVGVAIDAYMLMDLSRGLDELGN